MGNEPARKLVSELTRLRRKGRPKLRDQCGKLPAFFCAGSRPCQQQTVDEPRACARVLALVQMQGMIGAPGNLGILGTVGPVDVKPPLTLPPSRTPRSFSVRWDALALPEGFVRLPCVLAFALACPIVRSFDAHSNRINAALTPPDAYVKIGALERRPTVRGLRRPERAGRPTALCHH
jgi:hypothetical protein